MKIWSPQRWKHRRSPGQLPPPETPGRVVPDVPSLVGFVIEKLTGIWWFSINGGTQNHPCIDGLPLINHPAVGVPAYGKPHINHVD